MDGQNYNFRKSKNDNDKIQSMCSTLKFSNGKVDQQQQYLENILIIMKKGHFIKVFHPKV